MVRAQHPMGRCVGRPHTCPVAGTETDKAPLSCCKLRNVTVALQQQASTHQSSSFCKAQCTGTALFEDLSEAVCMQGWLFVGAVAV